MSETGESHEDDGSAAPRLVVGLGASAGGIQALRTFFSNVPANAGFCYVVVVHLSPDHDSQLAEVISSASPIPVTQVTSTTKIQRDHVYVIPPNRSLSMVDGSIVPARVAHPEQRRYPVDQFFRTLAESHGADAVAVVLSGTGADGSAGLKRVKEAGGLTVAQSPTEAEYGDMPHSAIATGMVDVIIPVAEAPGRIREYGERLLHAHLVGASDALVTDEQAARNILALLRVRTAHDFSHYKPGMVLRRMHRRQSIRGAKSLEEYTQTLRDDPDEAQALLKDLLIGVSSFFRDHAAFAALQATVIPKLFEGKHSDDHVRAWSAGCATGEEAYSLAMLLAEHSSDPTSPTVQVFASDLSESAIAAAREGFYTDSEVADISEERLQRFFQRTAGGYRIRRELRETVLFARHNIIADPPFSHLDLIACRNVLIYLNRGVQERLVETFHFALRPGGFLFLGLSEAPERTGELFATVDKSAHIYESRPIASVASFPRVTTTPPPPRTLIPIPESQTERRFAASGMHHQLLELYAPPSIVVTDEFHVVHVSQTAARYLRVPPGEPSRDIHQLIRPELRTDLRMALTQAVLQHAPVELGDLVVKLDDGPHTVRIIVRPPFGEDHAARGFILVLFEDQGAAADAPERPVRLTSHEFSDHPLHEELDEVRKQLRNTIEQYETHVEEAKASNEELQAMNEELRSATEELETSKEELQSVNEELTTVNQELKIKVEELSLTNNNFANLINSTEIATVFLDRSLRVKLSTPRAGDIFNLRPGDKGRPLSDITNRLADTDLSRDLRQVLERLHVVEREVHTDDGRVFLMRLLPYRTSDDRIDGIVITFLEISGLRHAEKRVRQSEERLRQLIDSATDYAIFTISTSGEIDSWSSGAERTFGFAAAEIVGRPSAVLFTPEDQAAGVPQRELDQARANGRAMDERWHLKRDGSRFYCSGVTTRLGDQGDLGYAKIARDLTQQRESELALRSAHEELERRVEERTSDLQLEVTRHTAARSHVTALMHKLVTAQEDQRARIARDLHDQLGQQLTALRLTLEQAARREPNPAAPDIARALTVATALNSEVDLLAWELRPAVLDDLGLGAALPKFVREWSGHYGLPAEFRSAGFETGDLTREAEVTFYRVAQEALNNVVKHAHATHVSVMLERRDNLVQMIIEDDGVGFDTGDAGESEKGVGIVGMQERVTLVGATLDIESSPSGGTTVYVRCERAAEGKKDEPNSRAPRRRS